MFLGKEAASLVDEMAKTRIQHSRSSGQAMPKLKVLSEQLAQLFAKDPDLLARSLERAFVESKPFAVRAAPKTEREPKMVNHPGVDLAVLLSQRGISVDGLAERISMPVQDIREILEGKRSIDEACANSLSRLLGGKASDWSTKQSKYDKYAKFLEAQARSAQAQ
jgi:plasmid maintenance system antidote protein VapI